ncbi:energy transducer TonB [Polaribacter vadi]|uniref:energy transducer TonB n=1 Tax=Polaribacter TaxID=52959 RepID=UPI001C097D6D|nr:MULTISPECIES: energy transducer TonB [Polaribacter]MBU3010066.1 energy transducer TonB [Polaribacter vadi]MDO6739873.1 energy transducer TonB [Polaribacter sp. 1_MG-2023]
MKNYLLIFTIFSFFIGFSQTNSEFDYEKYSNPNPENELSLYFKNEIKKKLLRNARFQTKKNNITLSFFINNERKPYNISVSSFGSFEFNKAVISTFKEFPLDKFSLDSLDTRNKYSLQIVSKKGSKNIFNCSTKLVVETPPVCEQCEDLKFYPDIKSCLNLEVRKLFYEKADFSILDNSTEDETDLYIQFSVTKSGELKMTSKTKVPLEFLLEADKIISSFPKVKTVSYKADKKTEPLHSFTISYKKGETPKLTNKEVKYDSIFKRSSTNELALYFIDKFKNTDINIANLSSIKNQVNLYFELDKKNKVFNVSTTSRSDFLDKKIIEIFNEYPAEKLNFKSKEPLKRYFLQILKYKDDKVFVETNSLIGSEKIPLFPGCENSVNYEGAKKCFSRGVQMHFAKKFDIDLPKKLGLSKGRKRVFIAFKINTKGKIVNIQVKAPHPRIKQEVIKVMKQMPHVEPGTQGGEPVNIKYNIPFTIIVE